MVGLLERCWSRINIAKSILNKIIIIIIVIIIKESQFRLIYVRRALLGFQRVLLSLALVLEV